VLCGILRSEEVLDLPPGGSRRDNRRGFAARGATLCRRIRRAQNRRPAIPGRRRQTADASLSLRAWLGIGRGIGAITPKERPGRAGLAGQSQEREVCPSHDSMSSRRWRVSRRFTKSKTARLYIRGRPSRH
jgi:hypothetical protein